MDTYYSPYQRKTYALTEARCLEMSENGEYTKILDTSDVKIGYI